MPAPVRKKLLQAEMTGYQELRDKILQRRASVQPSPAGKATAPAPAPAAPAPGAGAPPETLTQAIEELKAFIRAELKTLKEELRISARRP
jgi:3-oxoacyl-ACP reductase-like protein